MDPVLRQHLRVLHTVAPESAVVVEAQIEAILNQLEAMEAADPFRALVLRMGRQMERTDIGLSASEEREKAMLDRLNQLVDSQDLQPILDKLTRLVNARSQEAEAARAALEQQHAQKMAEQAQAHKEKIAEIQASSQRLSTLLSSRPVQIIAGGLFSGGGLIATILHYLLSGR